MIKIATVGDFDQVRGNLIFELADLELMQRFLDNHISV